MIAVQSLSRGKVVETLQDESISHEEAEAFIEALGL